MLERALREQGPAALVDTILRTMFGGHYPQHADAAAVAAGVALADVPVRLGRHATAHARLGLPIIAGGRHLA